MMKRAILLLSILGFGSMLSADEPEILPIGAEAPGFRLLGIDGEFHPWRIMQGAEVLTILFTANHCPTAQAYEGRVMELVECPYTPEQMQIVAISSNHPEAVCLEELGYSDMGDT